MEESINALRARLLRVREEVFATNKPEKFEKNIRKYFGKAMFEHFEKLMIYHQLPYMLVEVFSRAMQDIGPHISNIVEIYHKCIKNLELDLHALERECFKGRDEYLSARSSRQ